MREEFRDATGNPAISEECSLPLVSVLMPVYNAGSFLRPAILSILAQTYQNIELLIIDDGSTDGCINVNEELIRGDSRIKYVRQSNTGKPGALNHALRLMSGEFWLIQDADDLSYPLRVEKQLAAMSADPTLAAAYCKNDIILPDNRVFAPGCVGITPVECKMLIDNGHVPAHDATGMYRTRMVADFQFDEEMWLIEGVDYVLRVGEKLPVSVLPDCLYSHRVNYASVTHARADKIREATTKLGQKMARRRGIDYRPKNPGKSRESSWFKHRRFDTILPYAMTSIVEQRQCGRWREALRTALICATLHPFDWFYYKPLIYCLMPLRIIASYRAWKARAVKH